MKPYDVIVIGAGLMGCFSARNLTRYDMNICVLEGREDVCTGMTKGSTGIVYSGYDTKPGTIKAKLCVPGARAYEKLCKELDVRFSRCGSLMICFGPAGENAIKERYARGIENGVEGLRLVKGDEVLELEPNLSSQVRMGRCQGGFCARRIAQLLQAATGLPQDAAGEPKGDLGLIPERSLIDGVCFGDILPDWISVCGNCDFVHDIVDTVVRDAERLGCEIAEKLGNG